MVQTTIEKRRYTYEDYLKTSNDTSSRELEFELLRFVRANNLGEIFDAPCGVYFDNSNLVLKNFELCILQKS
ncbi:MAG: hypothetical protein QY310_05435 [Candidatus Jettenia sp. CY-1]|nr:MAG: hypothetical protein QY310_05435 [Candidatus Jettenia sp. CY-1]